MLEALGKAMRVENERQIDMATALSATGPTYIFLVMEALIDAGVHMGFSRHVAQDLVQQMMLGSVLFAKESHKHPAELRNMVTSPGGTSAEAIYQMEKAACARCFQRPSGLPINAPRRWAEKQVTQTVRPPRVCGCLARHSNVSAS